MCPFSGVFSCLCNWFPCSNFFLHIGNRAPLCVKLFRFGQKCILDDCGCFYFLITRCKLALQKTTLDAVGVSHSDEANKFELLYYSSIQYYCISLGRYKVPWFCCFFVIKTSEKSTSSRKLCHIIYCTSHTHFIDISRFRSHYIYVKYNPLA